MNLERGAALRRGESGATLGCVKTDVARTARRSSPREAVEDVLAVWKAAPWLGLEAALRTVAAATLLWGAAAVYRAGSSSTSARVARAAAGGAETPRDARWGDYAALASDARLFGAASAPVARPRPAARPAAPVVRKPTLAELAADFALVGVLDDGRLQAAILRKSTQQTVYVTAGQKIGDVAVDAVQTNRVTLSYGGQTMELSL